MKRTWSIINNTIKPKKKCTISKLNINNQTITEPHEMAEALNCHFAGIGTTLQNKIPSHNENNFRKYLPPALPNSIFLQPSTPSEVKNIIRELRNTKGNAHVMSTISFKDNKEPLSIPISYIFNSMVFQGQYPDVMKIACITALFKAGDRFDPNNYRPISSLPLSNRIFEN